VARYRSIDSDWPSNRKLRRLPLLARHLFLFLFTAYADDEGRFPADPLDIGEKCFSRADRVKEAQVAALLAALAEAGLVLLYEDIGVPYGFLPGWYEHQGIATAARHESALPPPPCEINSWQAADEVRAAYCEEVGKKPQGAYWRDALRWWEQHKSRCVSPEKSHSTETRVSLDGDSTNTRPDWKGLEGTGGELNARVRVREGTSPEAKPEAEPEPPPSPRDLSPIKAQNYPQWSAALKAGWEARRKGGWSVALVTKTVGELAVFFEEEDPPLPLDWVEAALREDPPRSSEYPGSWWRRQIGGWRQTQRVQGNGDEPDPLEAPYLKLWAETPELSVEKCPRLTERVNAWLAWIHAGGPRGSPGRRQRLEEYRERLHALGSWKTVPELTPEQFPTPPEVTANVSTEPASPAQSGG